MGKRLDYDAIVRKHQELGGSMTATAQALGIYRTTVRTALQRAGLYIPKVKRANRGTKHHRIGAPPNPPHEHDTPDPEGNDRLDIQSWITKGMQVMARIQEDAPYRDQVRKQLAGFLDEGVRFFHTIRHFEMWMDGDGYGRFEWDVALGKDDRITMTFDYHPDKPEAEDHHEA